MRDEAIFSSLITRNPSLAQVQDLFDDATEFSDFSGLPSPVTAGDVAVIVDARRKNIGTTRTNGIDISVNQSFGSDIGDFNVSINANYIFKLANAITPDAPFDDGVDTTFHPTDLRLRAGLAWSRQGWAAALFVNYISGYTNDIVVPAAAVQSWVPVDARVSYDFGAAFDAPLLRNLQISINVQNLLDEAPPFVDIPGNLPAAGYDPSNASPLGRFLSIDVTKRW